MVIGHQLSSNGGELMIKTCCTVIVVALLLMFSHRALALDCPSFPVQATKDTQGKVSLAVGRIGPVKGAELEAKAELITNDLLAKLPNADKVYLEQMMFSAYCSALRDDKGLTESEKADRIKAYIDGVRKAIAPRSEKKIKVPNLSPEIKCKLEYPLKLERDAVRKQINNPEITITNIGPIKAVAFSVDFKSYLYDVSRAAIDSSFEMRKETHGHSIFVKELQPSEDIRQDLNGFHAKGKVGIYTFDLKYYRESDMKMFTRQDMFFIEGYEIFSKRDYSKNRNYPRIIQAVKNYKPPSNAEPVCFLGIDNHVWFVKETPRAGVILLDDDRKGLTITGIPEDPRTLIKQNYLNANRPLLYVRPSRLKKPGTYLNPEIVNDDTVNIEIKYEVENVGDMEAVNISEVGGTPYNKPLKPGEKIYLNSGVTLINKSGHRQSPQELISNMDKQDHVIEHKDTVIYFQESGSKEYMVRFAYRIGKNNVQLIKYEMK